VNTRVWSLLVTCDRWIAPALAANPSTPLDLLIEMATCADEQIVRTLCHHRRRDMMPRSVAEALADHPEPWVRAALVERADTPLDIITKLADDPSRSVRITIAIRRHEVMASLDVYVPEPVYEKLARDPDRLVRGEILYSIDVPPRIKLILAEDPELRDIVLLRYGDPDSSQRALERMLADDSASRRLLALREAPDAPSPHLTETLLNDPDGGVRREAVRRCRLTRTQAETLASAADPETRSAVAGNPSVPDDVIRRLAVDPDESVRRTVVFTLPDIPVDLLDEIAPPTGPHDRIGVINWLWERQQEVDLLRAYARTRSIPHRRTVARIPELPADVIELLAVDDDFAVRLMLAEKHPDDVPVELLTEMVFAWDGYSGAGLARNPRLPDDVIERLSRSDEAGHRWRAVHSGRLTAEQRDRLAHDPDPRLATFVNPLVADPARLAEILASGTCDERRTAAAHPDVPADVLRELWRRIAPAS
jgi:hypothetical protein